MIAAFLGILAGMVLGFGLAGPLGSALGAVFGAAAGMLAAAAREGPGKAPAGAELAREEQRLLCEPNGQVVTATFLRDVRTGRWLDVEKCSLCPGEEIDCAKRCLRLMRDALPPRRHPVAAKA